VSHKEGKILYKDLTFFPRAKPAKRIQDFFFLGSTNVYHYARTLYTYKHRHEIYASKELIHE